ncbi:hypothetical protein IW148_004227 [Coemansia sp. RSA 1199]|nr:hypothetical protein IW148_004227 [Coemansia sp. RSA 1199]
MPATNTVLAADKADDVSIRDVLHSRLMEKQKAAEEAKARGDHDWDSSHKAMKGWSEARIKAFKAIKTKPNTYYYRFNEPGEEQRTGQWTAKEQRQFHARLKEIGANGQWGIFSMTIPGRVGYQCSNYYRYLVENRLIHDPNYMLDEKGKAHYLFTTKKKNPDGTAMRVFRKHRKPHVRMSREKYGYSDSDDAIQSASSVGKGGNLSADAMAAAIEAADRESTAKATPEPSATVPTQHRSTARAATAVRKRKRRGRYGGSSSDEDIIRANEVELSDGDDGDTSDGDYQAATTSKRRCARRRGFDGGNSSGMDSISAPALPNVESRTESGVGSDESGPESDGAGNADADPSNPLADLIDPITLEPVIKPAISPYGHVMGYNSWVRCLMFPPEGSQRNICPLTKKLLSKRDLVILTYDNIEQFRDKIVNL